jgi:hypothetical protein
MKTTTGKQGDYSLIDKAYKDYWSIEGTWEEKQEKRNEKIFVMTWEDSISNLSKVLSAVKSNKNTPEIQAQEITPIIRKGRRDVFIVTEDNLLFREIFYTELERQKNLIN